MQLIPDQRNSRATALMLLVIALLLVYLLFFHWFVLRHKEYAGEIGDLREQLNRFHGVASQREQLQERLANLRDSKNDADLFLVQSSFDEAAAAMSGDLGNIVRTQADDTCQEALIQSKEVLQFLCGRRFRHVPLGPHEDDRKAFVLLQGSRG